MVDISVEAHGGDVRTEDSRTEVFHTAIGEAIGDPYEGHTTGEDTRTPTDDVATISVDIVAEAYTWREERTDRRQVVVRDTVFLSDSRAIEVGVSRRTVEEEGHIDTQTVSQTEVIGSLPLIPRAEPPPRHVSHLVGLFPGTLFGKDQPEYLEAARATLNHRGDGGTGWSKANKINLWARLLDGNRAHRLLAEQLRSSTLENLWDTHAPFQIDGNFGATSGMAEMLLQSHTGYIAPLPALPDAWKDGQVSGLVARGNFEVSMKWKEKNLETLSFLSNVGGDLVVDYPNIESSIIKINGKEVQASRLKDNRIQLATQKGDVITFENFPGRVTRLSALRKDSVTAELDFNTVEGASHYVIRRESKDENSQTPSVREFITNQTHFIDRSIDSSHAYTYTVKAMLGDRTTPVSDPASIDAFSELMDDRDKRIQYGSAYGNWADSELFGGTEKYADISNGNYSDKDATATIPFNGPGIEIYGLKSSQLGLADVKIDGKSVGELDFYTAGATEKGVLIGRYTNLSSGPHLMTITVKRDHKGRANERAKISLDYFKVFPGQGEAVEKIDDRDPRIQYGSMFKDWSDAELYASTEKYADINADDSLASEATATIPFSGTGIRIYGLKTASLGKALVTLDGKEMPVLDFYTPGTTEKGALIGEFTNLADGDHVLTLKVDPDSPEERKKISLDSFDILKAPSVSLDSPSLDPIKSKDKTVTLTLPTGNWDGVAVTFPGIKDPLLLRKVDDDHLVTSGEQTVLTIKDNKVQLDIPEATDRKAGNSIEAYAIQDTTTTSPVVTVFPKDETAPVEEKILTSKGDEPAPVVTIPEYTDPIGTAGEQEAPTVEIPEYTGPIRTVGDQEAPTVEIPEYTGPIGTAGEQEAPTVEIPEYTGPIGTVGDQEAPTAERPEYTGPIGTVGDQEAPTAERPEYTKPIGTTGEQEAPTAERPEYTKPIGTGSGQAAPSNTVPEFKFKVLKDKTTRVQVISGTTELGGASYLDSQKFENKELLGKKYDAYALQLKDKDGQPVQPKGAVLVRLPISGAVQELYQLTSTNELKPQEFTIRDDMIEFITFDVSTYAIVYKTEGSTVKPVPAHTEERNLETTKPLIESNEANDQVSTNDKQLPATGEQASSFLFIAGLSLALSATFLLKGKKN